MTILASLFRPQPRNPKNLSLGQLPEMVRIPNFLYTWGYCSLLSVPIFVKFGRPEGTKTARSSLNISLRDIAWIKGSQCHGMRVSVVRASPRSIFDFEDDVPPGWCSFLDMWSGVPAVGRGTTYQLVKIIEQIMQLKRQGMYLGPKIGTNRQHGLEVKTISSQG